MDVEAQVKELVNKGTNLANEGKYREAELDYLKALQLAPEDIDVLSNLATLYRVEKRYELALVYCQRIFELDPYNVDNLALRVILAIGHYIWDNRDELIRDLRRALDELPAYYVRDFLMNPPHTFKDLYGWSVKRAAGDAKLQEILSQKPFDHSNHKVGKKIKIGWFTTDIGPSACGYVVGSLLESLDHEDFEWHCYCCKDLSNVRPGFETSLVERESKCFDFFYDVSDIKDEKQLAQKIYDDGIDIIVDINMFGNDAWRALAYKPAPIIIGFLGVPSTTGLPYYDYFIGDKDTIPEKEREFFTEKIMDMPFCYHAADIKADVYKLPISKYDVMLPENKVVYASFVTPFKVTPKYFDMWCRILKAVPNSVLWMRSRDVIDEDYLLKEAMKRGISPDRIVFLSLIESKPLFMGCFKLADLFLDSEIWQAHSTCLESLTSGVPLLTCPGDCFCARVPSTMLKTFGMPEMICKTTEEYEQKAIDLGLHPEKLNALKEKTRALKTPDNPLFDMVRFARNFENLLKKMLEEKNLK